MEAVQGELGVYPSGAAATVGDRLDAITTTLDGKANTADVNSALAAKGDVAGETWTGTHDFTGATVTGAGAGALALISPSSIANSGGSASSTGGTTTFSGVSSISLNGVFSAAYDNYRIVITTTASGAGEVDFRLRKSGTDLTGAVYTSGYVYITTVAGPVRANNNSASFAGMGFVGTTNAIVSLDIHGPAKAQPTPLVGVFGGDPYQGVCGGNIAQSTAYDGFTFYLTALTITGTVRVYGYQGA